MGEGGGGWDAVPGGITRGRQKIRQAGMLGLSDSAPTWELVLVSSVTLPYLFKSHYELKSLISPICQVSLHSVDNDAEGPKVVFFFFTSFSNGYSFNENDEVCEELMRHVMKTENL